jgi:hypothetical protein
MQERSKSGKARPWTTDPKLDRYHWPGIWRESHPTSSGLWKKARTTGRRLTVANAETTVLFYAMGRLHVVPAGTAAALASSRLRL